MLALSAAAIVTPTPHQAWAELCSNYVFRVGFWGWFCAQFAKARRSLARRSVPTLSVSAAPRHRRGVCCAQIFTRRYKTGVWDLTAFVDSGGMPSSHSSLCTVRRSSAGIYMHFTGRLPAPV